MPSSDFHINSYQLHESGWNKYLVDEEKLEIVKNWKREDTVDAWRHFRMLNAINPLLSIFPNDYWLTVGDGRYGSDAHYIEKHGVQVLATDISDTLLLKAKEEGFIKNYQKENAELMSFNNNQFDWVLCKEAYHHFPRPMIALYEMLRVAKKGVVLIEPQDKITSSIRINLLEKMKLFIKSKILKKITENSTIYANEFEEVGNYIYSISERELQKVALGIGLRLLAFKGNNDCYIPGVDNEEAISTSPLFKKVKRQIKYKDLRCKLKLQMPEGLVAIIFKEIPELSLINTLVAHDYDFISLPENPFAPNSVSGS